MRKRFIILIDFSDYSSNLIRYACDWAMQLDAELLLVHQTYVLAPALTDVEGKKNIAQQLKKDALCKLQSLSNELIPPIVKVSFFVSDLSLQITLPKILETPFESLIFAGIKGTGLLKKIFMGSVVLQVIESANHLVVAMPKEIATYSQRKIYVAVTDKYPLNQLELTKFLSFICCENTSITFFYLAKPTHNTDEMVNCPADLTMLYADRFSTDFTIYEGINIFADIKKVINNQIDEILVVQKGSRLLTDQLFRKFLINELVYEGQTPLVVLP